MLPIVLCSLVAMAIVIDRALALRRESVLPGGLVRSLRVAARGGSLGDVDLKGGHRHSPLGQIVAVGLTQKDLGREVIREAIEDTGRRVAHDLERFLDVLGTIAAITPLLGLLGTVVGMIEVFDVITTEGTGDTGLLAAGISTALITTAAGLTVAIPSLLLHRLLTRKVDSLVLDIEREAALLVDLLHRQSRRESRVAPSPQALRDPRGQRSQL